MECIVPDDRRLVNPVSKFGRFWGPDRKEGGTLTWGHIYPHTEQLILSIDISISVYYLFGRQAHKVCSLWVEKCHRLLRACRARAVLFIWSFPTFIVKQIESKNTLETKRSVSRSGSKRAYIHSRAECSSSDRQNTTSRARLTSHVVWPRTL